MNKEIKKKFKENRKEYLVRVTIFYLENIDDILNKKIIPIYDIARS